MELSVESAVQSVTRHWMTIGLAGTGEGLTWRVQPDPGQVGGLPDDDRDPIER